MGNLRTSRPDPSPAAERRLAILSAMAVLAGLAACAPQGDPGDEVRTADAVGPTLSGTVVVVNKQGNDASFIDVATGQIVATAPTGPGPHELVVSEDGRTAVVTDYGTGQAPGRTLTVLDVPSGERVATISLGDYTRPHGIAWMPDGETVAVTSEAAGAVVLVHVPDRRVVGAIETGAEGSHMLAVTADGEDIWTGDMGSNTVTRLSVGERTRLAAVTAPAQPEAVNVTPDGARVFAGSNATGRVTAFDASTGAATTVAEGFGWPYRIFLTPGIEQILIPDLENEVLRFFDGTSYDELGSIDFAGEGPQGLVLHPDGRHLFQSLSAADRIAIVDIDEREVLAYLPTGDGPDGIGYSPLSVAR